MSVITIVAPTGVLKRIERMIPANAQKTESIAEKTVTDLKLLKILIAESAGKIAKAGKITSADTRRDPTRFIASTMMTAITVAITKLRSLVFVPTAFAKLSSNVTAKNLLYKSTKAITTTIDKTMQRTTSVLVSVSIFIDPKMTELTRYDNLPHRLMDPVYKMDDAFETLEKVRDIMMDRYNYMRQNRLTLFNGGPIYVVIDELSALVFHDKNVVKTLSEIAMLGRAAKIHLICSTQLPTRKVLSNQVVANFDAKLCLHCADPISYRTVLGYTPTWTPENPGEAILWRSGKEKHIKACYTTLEDYDYYINHIEVTTPALNWSFA